MSLDRGEEFHGQLSSTVANGTLTLSYMTNSGANRTITATEFLFVTDLNLISVPGGAVSVKAYHPTDANITMSMFAGTVVANGGVARAWNTPFVVPAGWSLKVVAPAGQTDVQVEGSIIKA